MNYKDKNMPIDDRVEDLLQRMTLEEKVMQLQCLHFSFSFEEGEFDVEYTTEFNSELLKLGVGQISNGSRYKKPKENALYCNKIQKLFLENTRLGIPVIFHEGALHGHDAIDGTSYPTPMAMASSWNPKLVKKMTTYTAEEVRLRGGHLVLAPALDIARDARWGRVEETFGEDPYLISRMAVASITGFQGDNVTDYIESTKVASTTKHFIAHGSPEGGSNVSPTPVDEDTIYNIMVPPFKAAIQEAKVKGIMPSHCEINGLPLHANKRLLTGLLRDELKFEGLTVSDWFALNQLYTQHAVASDYKDAAVKAMKSGVDIELPTRLIYRYLIEAVKEGLLDEELIDQAVKRHLRLKFTLGLFDNPYVDPDKIDEVISNKERVEHCIKMGHEGAVLLKNENKILPLNFERVKKIGIVGPIADDCVVGNYSKEPKHRVSVLDAFKEKLPSNVELVYSEGSKIVKEVLNDEMLVILEEDEANLERIKKAKEDLADCDEIVCCLGTNSHIQREAWASDRRGDNANLNLRALQDVLVKELKTLNKPLHGVFFSGGPITFENIVDDLDSVLYCWYLGQETGYSVYDLLVGNVCPSGKLPISIPRDANRIPCFYNHKPTARQRGYHFDDETPLYPFGFGLSYTEFEYSNLQVLRNKVTKQDDIIVVVDVKNIGDVEAKEVVQLYIRDKISCLTRPVKELKDFTKINLKPGETETVMFKIKMDKLGFYVDREFIIEKGEFDIMVGGSSKDFETVTIELL